MATRSSVPATDGWTITDKGRDDLQNLETCWCTPKLAGPLVECSQCGTIYGSVKSGLGFGNISRDKQSWRA